MHPMKVAYSPVMTSDLKVLVNLDNCPLMCPIRVIRQLIHVQTSLHYTGHVLRVTLGWLLSVLGLVHVSTEYLHIVYLVSLLQQAYTLN